MTAGKVRAYYFLCFLAFYVLLASKVKLVEVVAALCAAAATAALLFWLRLNPRLDFIPEKKWFWLILRRISIKTLTNSGLVVLSLWRCSHFLPAWSSPISWSAGSKSFE
jgi:hypothetical protein